jgi:hypothetical protein
VPEGESHNISLPAAVSALAGASTAPIYYEAISGFEGVSPVPAAPAIASAPQTLPQPKAHSQYITYHGSLDFRAYKQLKGINGNIYIAKEDNLPADMHYHESTNHDIASTGSLPRLFSEFVDLPVLYTEASIQSFLAMNNQEDTLTQSQMLQTSDHNHFIAAQIPEIRVLEEMGVFQYKKLHELPPQAKLLSSIWSYRRKRRPNGELIKHKARICVDGSKQQYGRDYWET